MPSGAQAQLDLGEHVVQFYERDDELVSGVSAYLSGAISGGEAAVVIATEHHRAAFAEAVTAAGCDTARARRAGLLVELDAAETLASFSVGGRPDPDRFDAIVGSLVRGFNDAGLAVRGYGEMVGLLWDAGDIPAAIELEDLWNGLSARTRMSLYCAYGFGGMTGDERAAGYADVCHVHSSVVAAPAGEVTERFERSLESPRAARTLVARLLTSWGEGAIVPEAALVTTELASNAVRHGLSSFELLVSRRPGSIRIGVRDDGGGAPLLTTAAATECSGRGLAIVSAIARRWGHQECAGGKLVWAELAT